jgi:hypothetical protein
LRAIAYAYTGSNCHAVIDSNATSHLHTTSHLHAVTDLHARSNGYSLANLYACSADRHDNIYPSTNCDAVA